MDRALRAGPGRLLVLSYFFPPMSVGPAFVMGALMKHFDRRRVVIFTGDPDRYSDHREEPLEGVEVHQYDIPRWWAHEDRGRLRLRALGNVAVALRVAFAAARTLRRPDVDCLVTVYPKQHFLLAACIASVFSRKPLAVYFMDTYVEGLPRGRQVARLIERYIARRASLVFAMSDAHRREIEERWEAYGSRETPVVEISHPYEGSTDESSVELQGHPAIVFTGALYDAQAEAVRRLVDATGSQALAGLDPHVYLFTQSSRESLAALGIHESPRVHIRTASRGEARTAQRSGDIVFLPIAFDAPPHVIATASPSKTPEYLASETPILVHAPASAYVTRYAAAKGFAEIVSSPDVHQLASAIERLTLDPELRRQLTERALLALEEHRAPAVAKRFSDAIGRELGLTRNGAS